MRKTKARRVTSKYLSILMYFLKSKSESFTTNHISLPQLLIQIAVIVLILYSLTDAMSSTLCAASKIIFGGKQRSKKNQSLQEKLIYPTLQNALLEELISCTYIPTHVKPRHNLGPSVQVTLPFLKITSRKCGAQKDHAENFTKYCRYIVFGEEGHNFSRLTNS